MKDLPTCDTPVEDDRMSVRSMGPNRMDPRRVLARNAFRHVPLGCVSVSRDAFVGTTFDAMRVSRTPKRTARACSTRSSKRERDLPLGLRRGVEDASSSALSLAGVGRPRMSVVLPLEVDADGSNEELIAAANDSAEAFARPLRERFGRESVYISLPLSKQRIFKNQQCMEEEVKKVKEGRFQAVILAFPQKKELDFVLRINNVVSPSSMVVILNPLMAKDDFFGTFNSVDTDLWGKYAQKFEAEEAYAYVQQKVNVPITIVEMLLNMGVTLTLLKRFREGWSVYARPGDGEWECALEQRHRPTAAQLRTIAEKYHGDYKSTTEMLTTWLGKNLQLQLKRPHFG